MESQNVQQTYPGQAGPIQQGFRKFKPRENSEVDWKRMQSNTEFDEKQAKFLRDSDKQFLKYIVEMYNSLSGDSIDLNQFSEVWQAIEALKTAQEHDYYNTLIKPERTRGSKIPSQIPMPSSSFQLKQSFYITTNSTGNASVIINPFFLSSSGNNSTIFLNNDVTLTGLAPSNFFTAINGGQTIPAVYNQYRLVSASIVAKYVGRLDIVQGLIGGAIVFDQNITPAAVGTVNPNLAKYGDFNLAQDAFFQQENYTIQGMREIYFPLDTTFEQYQPTGTSKNGYGMLLYILGAPPSSNIFKLDMYFNMECLPDVTFLSYIPVSVAKGSPATKGEAVSAAQQAPITTSEVVGPSSSKQDDGGSVFEDVMNGIGMVIPGVGMIGQLLGGLF